MPANFHVPGNHQEILLKCRFWLSGPGEGWDPTIPTSSQVMLVLRLFEQKGGFAHNSPGVRVELVESGSRGKSGSQDWVLPGGFTRRKTGTGELRRLKGAIEARRELLVWWGWRRTWRWKKASDGVEVKKVGLSYQICLARHQKQLMQFLEAEIEMQLQLYLKHWRKNTAHHQFIVLSKHTKVKLSALKFLSSLFLILNPPFPPLLSLLWILNFYWAEILLWD